MSSQIVNITALRRSVSQWALAPRIYRESTNVCPAKVPIQNRTNARRLPDPGGRPLGRGVLQTSVTSPLQRVELPVQPLGERLLAVSGLLASLLLVPTLCRGSKLNEQINFR